MSLCSYSTNASTSMQSKVKNLEFEIFLRSFGLDQHALMDHAFVDLYAVGILTDLDRLGDVVPPGLVPVARVATAPSSPPRVMLVTPDQPAGFHSSHSTGRWCLSASMKNLNASSSVPCSVIPVTAASAFKTSNTRS